MYLTEREMLPQIRMARLYDTEKAGVVKKTKQRVADCYELGFYLTDSGFLMINEEQKQIRRGDVRLTRPGDQISSVPPYRCYTIFFHFDGQEEVCHNEFLDAIPDYFHVGGHCQSLFEQAVEMFESQSVGAGLMQNALLLQILYQCYQELHAGTPYCQAVKHCVEYMQDHLAEDVTLEKLGEISGYSSLHVRRLFLRDTMCSPHEYLSRMRMAKARRMLADSDVVVSRIAVECGFSSESYFQMLFKKVNGCTPGEYRRSARVL